MFLNQPRFVTLLFAPLSLIYGIIVWIRNILFDYGILKSRRFDIPVVSVGNITVGGTGKTPHVEFIVSLLTGEFKMAVLSRGYKRETRGFVLASTASKVKDIGDEPLQIKKKHPEIIVAVDRNRSRGINRLCKLNEDLQVVVMDDGFQHRWVKAGIAILLIDYNRQPKDDFLLPMGRLREPLSAKNRAAIVVVTKCPADMKPIERRILSRDLDLFPWQSLYFSTIEYLDPLPVFSGFSAPDMAELKIRKPDILMVTGIVSPRQLKKHLRGISPKIKELTFPDHHQFTTGDISKINRTWESMDVEEKIIITTEKDAARFCNMKQINENLKSNMFYIPIQVKFIDSEEDGFRDQILNYVRNNKKDHLLV